MKRKPKQSKVLSGLGLLMCLILTSLLIGNGSLWAANEFRAGTSAFMQQIEVNGVVTDISSRETLPGVNVTIVGTTLGTMTGVDGRYTLRVTDPDAILEFSYIGYTTQRIVVGDRRVINVQLAPDIALLDEVVVVGYGTQLRTEVTGSIVSIRPETVQNVPVSSFETALQGRMAGVNVAESTGEPGAAPQILIRGTGSISAGNEPLYVIDGVPVSQNYNQQENPATQRAAFPHSRISPLASLNPNDIESIEVLKDASAAAIYGSRGSNGVILITTKRGRRDTPAQFSFSAYGGVQSAFNIPEMMNAEDLIAYTKDSRNNTYLRVQNPTDPASPFYNPQYDPNTNAGREESGATGMMLIPEAYVNWDGTDTDWLSLVLGTAVLQNYNMSVSGGGENMTYFFGGGYMDQTGIIEGSGFKRYSLTSNINAFITERFQMGLNLSAALTDHDRKAAGTPYFANPPGIIYSAMTQSPVVSPWAPDGSYAQTEGSHNQLGGGTTTTNHPLAARDYIDEFINNNRLFGNLNASYALLDNLNFRTMLGFDLDNYQRSYYMGTQLYYRGGAPRPFAESSSATSFNWLWENTMDYQLEINENHRLSAVVGFTAQKQRDERNRVIAQHFPDDQIRTIGGGQVTGGSQHIEEWSLVSYLARINYVMMNRYLLTATVRSDRSSRFGLNNQTGVFPSMSLGWLMLNEPFMQGVQVFNQLKPRVSYGVTGNFLIPNYGSIGLLTGSNYVIGGQVVAGAVPITLGNAELTWETTRQFNIGVDFALLENRIFGTFDYYISNTTDLLLMVNIPAVTGFTSALTNIGEVENKGFEIQITSRNMVGEFAWTTDFNFGTNKNEVLRLGPEGDPILVPGAAGVRHITQIGSPIGSYWGYQVVGIFNTQQEIDAAPNDTQANNPTPGDFQFKDVDGDGQITPDDRTVIGSYHPDFTWGINNTFSWRNIDFSFFFQGVEGREVLNLTSRHMRNGEANFGSYAILNDRWRSPEQPGNGIEPKAERTSGGNNNRPSSYQVEDGSYVKLRNITLGYTLPPHLTRNMFRQVRLYAAVTNVAIWTDYIGFNPEVNLSQGASAITPGEDYGAYPLSRAFQIGLDISF